MEYARTFAGSFKAYVYVFHVAKHIALITSRGANHQGLTVLRNAEEKLTEALEQFFGQELKPRHDLIHSTDLEVA